MTAATHLISGESTPFAGHNAVESASFLMVFSGILGPAAVDGIIASTEILSQDLPGLQRSEAAAPVPGLATFTLPEMARVLTGTDGSIKWRLSAGGNTLAVQCNEYTRFDEVLAKALRYLQAALDGGTHPVPLQEIGFQVIDKFVYPPGFDRDTYRIDELFKADCPYLTPQSAKSGPLWHVHSGWFQPANTPQPLLNQINISNVDMDVGLNKQLGTTIDHRVILRLNGAMTTADFKSGAENQALSLEHLFRQMHSENKAAIMRALRPEKLQQIGMGAPA